MNNQNIRTNKLLNRASLSAAHWWVVKEYDHHKCFKNLKDLKDIEDKRVREGFYRFTQEYSLLQGTKGKRSKTAHKTLRNLVTEGFVNYTLKDDSEPYGNRQ